MLDAKTICLYVAACAVFVGALLLFTGWWAVGVAALSLPLALAALVHGLREDA